MLLCCCAVHVNGKEQDIGLDATLPSGLMVSYLNNTVPDGTLWFKPGEWSLPQVQINTPRYAADHICLNHQTAKSPYCTFSTPLRCFWPEPDAFR